MARQQVARFAGPRLHQSGRPNVELRRLLARLDARVDTFHTKVAVLMRGLLALQRQSDLLAAALRQTGAAVNERGAPVRTKLKTIS